MDRLKLEKIVKEAILNGTPEEQMAALSALIEMSNGDALDKIARNLGVLKVA